MDQERTRASPVFKRKLSGPLLAKSHRNIYKGIYKGIARIQASVAGKKTRGLAVLLGISREPRARPIRGRVADLFCVGRGDFVTLIRNFMSESSAKSENFSCGLAQPNQCCDWLVIREVGSDWLVISFMHRRTGNFFLPREEGKAVNHLPFFS